MKSKNSLVISKKELQNYGDYLVSDFQNSFMTKLTIETSKAQAKISEVDALDKIANYKNPNDIYLSPTDLPVDDKESIQNASLDAHLKKVQASQIENYGNQKISELKNEVDTKYRNRKIKITVLNKKIKPIHNAWIDSRYGRIYYVKNIGNSVSGSILEVNLKENFIKVRPNIGRKLINHNLDHYIIEVLNPADFSPLIKIKFYK
jgi:hypothetical protein